MINPGEPTHERVIFETSDQPPAMVTLTHQAYPEGSIGFQLFPEVLEGRVRPVTFSDVALNMPTNHKNALQAAGVHTVSDLLMMDADRAVALFPEKRQAGFQLQLQRRMETLAEKNVLTPHARLIGAALGEEQGPVSPEEEPVIEARVEMALGFLNERERHILSLRFGLDGNPSRTLDQAGDYYAISSERVRQIESKALARMRHPERREFLDDASVYPLDSIARQAGYTYRSALPIDMRGNTDLELSSEAEALLNDLAQQKGMSQVIFRARNYRYQGDISSVGELTVPEGNDEIRAEIVQKFERFIHSHKHLAVFGKLLPDIAEISKLEMDSPERQAIETEELLRNIKRSITRFVFTERDAEGNERLRISERNLAIKSPQTIGRLVHKLGGYLGDLFPAEEPVASEQ